MAEKTEIILTDEQVAQKREVTEIIASAIGTQCTCTTARLAPERIGLAFARGRIKDIETVSEIAGRFAICSGMANGECHYPSSSESI